MRRIIALLLIGALLVLPVASADDSGQTGNQNHELQNELKFTAFPQVYVNVSNNASFNVSYIGVILVTTSGIYYSYFPAQNWVITRNSNTSVSYRSHVMFQHLDSEHIAALKSRFNVTSLGDQTENHMPGEAEVESIAANVTVSMMKVHISSPVNGSNSSSNLTGFKLSFSLSSSQIKGPGQMFLIQTLGARIHNGFEAYHSLAAISKDLQKVNGSAIGLSSTNYDAYYWWGPTYTINGHTENLTASSSQVGNSEVLVFKFQFKNGVSSLSQDPYFSIPQINLFNNPILQKDIQNAANFIVLHIELFAAGLITGSMLVGISYASYRRKRY